MHVRICIHVCIYVGAHGISSMHACTNVYICTRSVYIEVLLCRECLYNDSNIYRTPTLKYTVTVCPWARWTISFKDKCI